MAASVLHSARLQQGKFVMYDVEAGDPPCTAATAKRPAGYKLDAWNRDQWSWEEGVGGAMLGITIAAACFPCIAAAVAFLVALVTMPASEVLRDFERWLYPALGMLFTTSIASAFVALIMGCALLLGCGLVLGPHRCIRHTALIGTLCGGITAGVGILPWAVPRSSSINLEWHLFWFLLVPCLATLCCQIGGGWGMCAKLADQQATNSGFQFRLRHAFLLTTWLAVFFAVARWGLREESSGMAVMVVWLVFQAGTAWLVMQGLAWRGWRPSRVGTAVEPLLE